MKIISKNIGCGKTTELVNRAGHFAIENNTTVYITSPNITQLVDAMKAILESKGIFHKWLNYNMVVIGRESEESIIKLIPLTQIADVPLKKCLFVDDYDLIKEEVLLGHLNQIHTLTVTPTDKEF